MTGLPAVLRNRRLLLVVGGIVVVALVAVGIVALAQRAPGPGGTAPEAAPAAEPEPLEGQIFVKVGTTFGHGVFEATVGYAAYDEVTKRVALGIAWHNLSDRYQSPPVNYALTLEPGPGEPAVSLRYQETSLPLPPGATANLTFLADGTFDANPLDEAALIIGSEQPQYPGLVTRIALRDGSTDSAYGRTDVAFDDWANVGDLTVHVKHADLRPGTFDNASAPAGGRILHVDLDVWNSAGGELGWQPEMMLALRMPDGTLLHGLNTGEDPDLHLADRYVSWGFKPDRFAEYALPSTLAGTYQLWLVRRQPGFFDATWLADNTHVVLPVTLTDADFARRAEPTPAGAELAIPRLPPREDLATATPPPAQKWELDARLRYGEFELDITGAEDAVDEYGRHTITFDGSVTLVDSTTGTGIFDTQPQLSVKAALETTGRQLRPGIIYDTSSEPDNTVPLDLTFTDVHDFDPATARLWIGSNLVVDLADTTAIDAPAIHQVDAAQAAVGEYIVQVDAWQRGQLTHLDLPPGREALRIYFTITLPIRPEYIDRIDPFVLAMRESFTPERQILWTYSDRYVAHAQGALSTPGLQLEPNVPASGYVTYIVDKDAELGRVWLTLRNRDEIAPKPNGWIRTIVPVTLLDAEGPAHPATTVAPTPRTSLSPEELDLQQEDTDATLDDLDSVIGGL